ncbi:hypothetical protein K2X85_18850 [bacterium]|nr:hypothetical protein [bacterium]
MLTLPDPCDTAFLTRSLSRRIDSPAEERRRFPRQSVTGPAQLVPLTLDGPDFSRSLEAELQDIARGGAAVTAQTPPLGPHWAIVIPQSAGNLIMEIAIRDLRRLTGDAPSKMSSPFRIACQFTRRIRMAS